MSPPRNQGHGLPDFSTQLASRIGKHEAGHYVIARVCGFKTYGMTLKLLHPRNGGGHIGGAVTWLNVDLSDNANVITYLRGRVLCLYAGVLAEALSHGTGVIDFEAAKRYITEGGNTDHAKIRELINLIRNIKHGAVDDEAEANAQLAAIDEELEAESIRLVLQEHKMIEALGTRLAQMVLAYDVQYRLEEDVINAMRPMQARFPTA